MRCTNKIGYLVPEFPGQTHNFFWRELRALKELGLDAILFSTRKPPPGLMSTSWGEQAIKSTTYLFPLSGGDFFSAFIELFRSGPSAWANCIRTIYASERQSLNELVQLFGLMLVAAKIKRLARQQGLSHIHVHSCGNSANIALFAKLLKGPTYGLTLHNPLSVFGGNQALKWRHSSYGIIITEKLVAQTRQELGADFPENFAIAPMGVDTTSFQRHAPYQAYSGQDEFRIFCCGRLNLVKGQLELLDSVAMLIHRGLNTQLVIAGEDDHGGSGFRKELELRIVERSLQNHVKLMGAQPEEVITEQLSRAHVFALASYEEPLGVSIMEAMSMEVPVVATSAGGVPELVRDKVDGLLVAPRHAVAFSDALTWIAEHPQDATRFGQNGRQRILERFDSSRSAETIQKFVTSCAV